MLRIKVISSIRMFIASIYETEVSTGAAIKCMRKTNAIYFERIDLAMCQQQTNLTRCHDLKLKQKKCEKSERLVDVPFMLENILLT